MGIMVALFSTASIIPAHNVDARIVRDPPLYQRGDSRIGNTPYHITANAKPDTNCFDYVYLRGVPRGENHVVLNSQYIRNLNPSDTPRTTGFDFDLYFLAKKAEQSPVKQMRWYFELGTGYEGTTIKDAVQFYIDWNPVTKKYVVNDINGDGKPDPVILKTHRETCHEDNDLTANQLQQPSSNYYLRGSSRGR